MINTNNKGTEETEIINSYKNLPEVLENWSEKQPDSTAYIMLNEEEKEEKQITYRQLSIKAKAIASRLMSLGLNGKRALMLYPSSIEYITAFFGCLYAGIIAVPAYPPRRNQKLSRIISIINDAEPDLILTNTDIKALLQNRVSDTPELGRMPWLDSLEIADAESEKYEPQNLDRHHIAFLQYTSGSTGNPKGVMVTHGNLLYNEEMIRVGFSHNKQTIFISWLPIFHDMGLIGNVLQPFYLGVKCILMSPEAFLQKPVRWLRAITRYKGTTTGGPNFAYELCCDRIKAEDKKDLDLSSLEIAYSGSEPVRAETIERFSREFAECGFKKQMFYPCFGMAETTLFVTGGLKSEEPVIRTIDKNQLEKGKVQPSGENAAKEVVGCGRTWLEQEILIVNPETKKECRENEVGEIWIKGNNIARGYWNQEQLNKEIFEAYTRDSLKGPFLRTGDLGFLQDKELYITGRLKDMIIIRGKNHYPHDIELTAENSDESLQKNACAAFSIDIENEEKLVVVQELKRTHMRNKNHRQVIEKMREQISQKHEIDVYAIVLVRPLTIAKTSSGKIQRKTCKQQFTDNNLTVIEQWQSERHILSETGEADEKTTKENQALTDDYIAEILPDNEYKNMNDLQRKVFSIVLETLIYRFKINPRELDVSKSIFFYGIDSMKIIDIHSELESRLKEKIHTEAFFAANTITGMVDDIVRNITDKDRVNNTLDNAEIFRRELDENIRKLNSEYEQAKELLNKEAEKQGKILFTGATGYVGIYILKELLETKTETMVCIVRAKDKEAGLERILRNGEKYKIKFKKDWIARIEVVIGDTSKQKFGVTETEYEILCTEIDEICHCAAVDNFYLPYTILNKTNVYGTVEIMLLAMRQKIKPVYYISSCAASLLGDNFDDFQTIGLLNGYAQTKYAAEKLILNLIDRGFPVKNYRLGYLYSLGVENMQNNHSIEWLYSAVKAAYQNNDDLIDDNDSFETFINSVYHLGYIPDIDASFDLMPIEYAVRCIVSTANFSDKENRRNNYTFYNPVPLKWKDVVKYFKKNYPGIEPVSIDKFVDIYQEYILRTDNKSVKLLKSIVSTELESQLNTMFRDINTDEVQDHKYWCPPCDKKFTEHYLNLVI